MKRKSRSRSRDGSSGAGEEHGGSSTLPRLLAALVIGCGIALAVATRSADDARDDGAKPTIARATAASAEAHPAEPRSEGMEQEQADEAVTAPEIDPMPDDPLSERWDALPPAERIRIQRDRFADAIAGLRAGADVDQNLAQARDALTVLRPEMHDTVDGRAEHLRLEARLDALAEGDAANPAGSAR